jgi:hypothetical protein
MIHTCEKDQQDKTCLFLTNLFQLDYPLHVSCFKQQADHQEVISNRIVLAARHPTDAREKQYAVCTEITS